MELNDFCGRYLFLFVWMRRPTPAALQILIVQNVEFVHRIHWRLIPLKSDCPSQLLHAEASNKCE